MTGDKRLRASESRTLICESLAFDDRGTPHSEPAVLIVFLFLLGGGCTVYMHIFTYID